MKKFFHILICFILISTLMPSCDKQEPYKGISDKYDVTTFVNPSNAVKMLPLMAENGYTVYSVIEDGEYYHLEFTDCPVIEEFLYKPFQQSSYNVPMKNITKFTGDGKNVYFTLSDNNEVSMPIRTDSAEDLLIASDGYAVIRDYKTVSKTILGKSGSYYTINFVTFPNVKLLRGVQKSFESIDIEKDRVRSISKEAITFADGRTASFSLKAIDILLEEDVLLEDGNAPKDVRFELNGEYTNLTATAVTNNERIKAVVSFDNDNKGGVVQLQPQNFERFDCDSATIKITVTNGKQTVVKKMRAVFDDLGFDWRITRTYTQNDAVNPYLKFKDEDIQNAIGVTEFEANTYYKHIALDPGYVMCETGPLFGSDEKPCFFSSADEIQYEIDETGKELGLSIRTSYHLDGSIIMFVKPKYENTSGQMKICTISIKRRNSKKVIYYKMYFDYRTLKELYGIEYSKPETWQAYT